MRLMEAQSRNLDDEEGSVIGETGVVEVEEKAKK